MRYALLECVFTLSGLCGLFVCNVLFGRDVCLSALCCLVVMFVCLDCVCLM